LDPPTPGVQMQDVSEQELCNSDEDRTSKYCANLAMTFRNTSPALAGRGATDKLMDERAEFVERRGGRSLTPL
jgi:hypothetical protein